MAQSTYTAVVTYNTATASAAPSAGNLVQGELAVNVTDKKIYTKNSGGSVVQVGSGPDATETLTNKTLTNPDINGGTIDGTVIGNSSAASGKFTSLASYGNSTSGASNSAIGYSALVSNVTGVANVSVGWNALSNNTSGSANTSIGAWSLAGILNSGSNTAIGYGAGQYVSGDYNTYLGGYTGNQGGLDFRALNNKVVLSDGAGNVVLHAQGDTGAVSIPGTLALTGASSTLGYGTGAGGTVTQATDNFTGVTLNKPSGKITMSGVSLPGSSICYFTLTNSLISSKDVMLVQTTNGDANLFAHVISVGSGSCEIVVRNFSASAYVASITLNFAVIKGATS